MKAVKELEHGILLNYFGLGSEFYLALTILTCFDFNDPDRALSEQELWPFVQGELGPNAILDMAMPKPLSEVLVWGRCFNPGGVPRPASQVGFQIGPIRKTLNVYGNRSWRRRGGLPATLTDPEPFAEMPLGYAQAFGGPGYDKNPLGKGFVPTTLPSGEEILPLPNVEDPRRLVGAPSDRPEPAGFAPLDGTWPQRMKKLGTYDQRWYQTRWPFYPEDMDWTYFNAAPVDQRMEGFFGGGEAFIVQGMHRTRPVIQSRLPALRHRLFINQLNDPGDPAGGTTFREVTNRLETVWLFPHAERGIALFRGAARVGDDEALDVRHLFVATEALADTPKPIEHYQAEFTRRLDRAVSTDLAARTEEARKKMAEMADRLRDLPRRIDDAIGRNLGTAPKPVRTPEEIVSGSLALIAEHQRQLAEAETEFQGLKSEFGHRVKIDTSAMARAKSQREEAVVKLQALPATIAQTKTKHKDILRQMAELGQDTLNRVEPALAAEKRAEVDQILAAVQAEATDPWQEAGMRFLERCRHMLLSHPRIMTALAELGLRRYTVERHWLGFHPSQEFQDPKQWGLPEEAAHRENPRELLLVSGFVIPCFVGAKLHRIRIRSSHGHYPPPDLMSVALEPTYRAANDFWVEGSRETALVHGAGPGKPFVRVAFEIDSVLLHQEVGDFCAVATLPDPEAKLDDEVEKYLQEAPQFLVVMYPESGLPADREIEVWRRKYPQAEPLFLPAGADLTVARRHGLDLWQWVADALRPGVAPPPESKPQPIDPDQPGAVAALVPVIDVKGLVQKVKNVLTAQFQASLGKASAEREKGLGVIREQLGAKGIDLDELMKSAPELLPEDGNPYSAAKTKYAEKFSQLRQQIEQHGLMKPEIERELAEAEQDPQTILDDAAKRFDDGMAQLGLLETEAQAGPPAWARKLMAQAGIDPDDPAPLRKLSRAEVIERHGRGQSLAGKNLSGTDLSGLNLTGIDLRRANLQKTNFSGATLDQANLEQAIATEADFSQSWLRGAAMRRGLFQKAKFARAKLQASDLSQAILSEADLSEADLTGARLEKTLLEKASLAGATLGQSQGTLGYFLNSNVAGADFSGADLTKAIFLEANVDQAQFTGTTLRQAFFVRSKGRRLNFAGADLQNVRILNGSELPESDFSHTRADRASLMRSDLSGADFKGSSLGRALVEECNLTGADLAGVKARQARLTKSDLTGANLRRINLFQGSLRKSKLVRTDLGEANLYNAEFYRTGVGDTRLDGTNLKMTQLAGRADLLPNSGRGKKPDDPR